MRTQNCLVIRTSLRHLLGVAVTRPAGRSQKVRAKKVFGFESGSWIERDFNKTATSSDINFDVLDFGLRADAVGHEPKPARRAGCALPELPHVNRVETDSRNS